jgi:hypothetical protein
MALLGFFVPFLIISMASLVSPFFLPLGAASISILPLSVLFSVAVFRLLGAN